MWRTNLRNWKRNSASAMYSASVRGLELFALAILSSHDTFVAFYWIWAGTFVRADFRREKAPNKYLYGMPALVQKCQSSSPHVNNYCAQLWCTRAIHAKPRLALSHSYQLLSVFYFGFLHEESL